jgi:aminopeptidase S
MQARTTSTAVSLPFSRQRSRCQASTITLRLCYFVGFLANATSEDFFRIRVVGANGAAQTIFTRSGTASKVPGVWTLQSVNISQYAGQTVHIRLEASDTGSISLVEAGVDDLVVTRQ